MPARLPRAFYQCHAVTLARALLGQRLVRTIKGQRVAGLIVETEAYLGTPDKAAHTFGGRRTPRNETMWGEAGHLYVYFTYGMHHCANVVARGVDVPEAVLLRALEPVEGVEMMRRRRRKAHRETDLCSGPAKLCQALALNRDDDGADLTRDAGLSIERTRQRTYPASRIVTAARVGVGYAEEWADKPLRFYLKDNPHVSRR